MSTLPRKQSRSVGIEPTPARLPPQNFTTGPNRLRKRGGHDSFTIKTMREGEPSAATSTFTQLLSSDLVEVLLYGHRNRRLIRDGSPGSAPRLSHSSWALILLKCCFTATETVGLLGTEAQDVHLDCHTAPELWWARHRWPPTFVLSRLALGGADGAVGLLGQVDDVAQDVLHLAGRGAGRGRPNAVQGRVLAPPGLCWLVHVSATAADVTVADVAVVVKVCKKAPAGNERRSEWRVHWSRYI